MHYLKKEFGDPVDFLYVVRNLWKLQNDHVILVGCGQACPGMSTMEIKNKSSISLQQIESFSQIFLHHENHKLITSFQVGSVIPKYAQSVPNSREY